RHVEVAVVLDRFLAPLQVRAAALVAPPHGHLPRPRPDLPPALPLLPETVRLVRDGATKGLVAVQVLDLALRRPERLAAFLKADRHVDVEAARALLEPHLGHAGADEDVPHAA